MSAMSVSTSSNDVKNIETGPESPADIRKRKRRRVSSIPEGLDDTRISHLGPLIPPCCLLEQLPLSEVVADVVSEGRKEVQDIVQGRDDRLVCVVGPCSVHDPKAAKEYALVSCPFRPLFSSSCTHIERAPVRFLCIHSAQCSTHLHIVLFYLNLTAPTLCTLSNTETASAQTPLEIQG